MTEFLMKIILRVFSILGSIILLKIALEGIITYDALWIRIIYVAIIILGIPLIFLLTNVIANLIKYGNKK